MLNDPRSYRAGRRAFLLGLGAVMAPKVAAAGPMSLMGAGKAAGSPPPPAGVTWDPVNKGTHVVLSTDLLTATADGTAGNGIARTTVAVTSGQQKHVEALVTNYGFGRYRIGWVNALYDVNATGGGAVIGQTPNGLAYFPDTGIVRMAGSTLVTVQTCPVGQRVGLEVDRSTNKGWIVTQDGQRNTGVDGGAGFNLPPGDLYLAGLIYGDSAAVYYVLNNDDTAWATPATPGFSKL